MATRVGTSRVERAIAAFSGPSIATGLPLASASKHVCTTWATVRRLANADSLPAAAKKFVSVGPGHRH